MTEEVTPLSDEERAELEALRAEKKAREEAEAVRKARAELAALRAEKAEAEAAAKATMSTGETTQPVPGGSGKAVQADFDTGQRAQEPQVSKRLDSGSRDGAAKAEKTFGQRMVSDGALDKDDIPGMAPAQKLIIGLALVVFIVCAVYIALSNMGAL